MNDLLFKCAENFKNLLNTEYQFTCGRKGVKSKISLAFSKYNFFHLAGLHKLKDLTNLKKTPTKIFDSILERKITYLDISYSPFFPSIEDRMKILRDLERMLDHDKLVFTYNQEKSPFYSKILAEYVIEHNSTDIKAYIFLKKDGNDSHYSCNSCFRFDGHDYTRNQSMLTLLEKKKINTLDNTHELLYIRDGYIP